MANAECGMKSLKKNPHSEIRIPNLVGSARTNFSKNNK